MHSTNFFSNINHKISLAIILVLLSGFLSSCSGSGKYGGRVLDKVTLEPIPQAQVFLDDTNSGLTISTYTDENGKFEFDLKPLAIPEGKITIGRIRVYADRYESYDKQVPISNQTSKTDEDIILIPKDSGSAIVPSPFAEAVASEQPELLCPGDGSCIQRPKELLKLSNIRQITQLVNWYMDSRYNMRRVRISNDGTRLAVAIYHKNVEPNGLVYLWRIDEVDQPLVIDKGTGGVSGLDFSTDGKYLAWSTWAYTVGSYDIENLSVLFKKDYTRSHSLAFQPNTSSFAVGFDSDKGDGRSWVDVFEVGNPIPTSLVGDTGIPMDIEFSDNGKYVVATSLEGITTIVELRSGTRRELTLDEEGSAVGISASGKLVAGGGKDGTIVVWNRKTEEKVFETSLGYEIGEIIFSPDETMLIVSSAKGDINFYDIESGEMAYAIHQSESIYSIDLSSDGSLLVSGSEDGKVVVWGIAP